MNKEELRAVWKQEEDIAYIKGWDFSHIQGKYREEELLPWDYREIIKQYINDTATCWITIPAAENSYYP